MYYGRSLSTDEQVYINKAQQRIAAFGGSIAEEISRNDATYEDTQISAELEYSINVLKYSALDWTSLEIQTMMDFYSLRANLSEYAVCVIAIVGIPVLPGVACASIEYVEGVRQDLLTIINQQNSDLIDLINSNEEESIDRDEALALLIGNAGANLTEEITSLVDVGGIRDGDIFPVNTPLTEMWKAILDEPAILSNMQITGVDSLVTEGDVSITSITWDTAGVVGPLILTDNKGVVNGVSVSGGSYAPSGGINANLSPNEVWSFTLSSDSADSIAVQIEAVYNSYSGMKQAVNDIPIIITEIDLISAESNGPSTSKYIVKTNVSITVNIPTLYDYQGWIAVPVAQTETNYTKWYVDEINSADINSNAFILPPQNPQVLHNGILYDIYRWGYRSNLSEPLKLHK